MIELRTEAGVLAGTYKMTRKGFLFEYKSKKGLFRIFLPLFPMLGKPIVTME